jgi:hypothetical protein
VRAHLAPYEYPKEIEFIDALPMTTTGKVQRRVLRERERERKAALARGVAVAVSRWRTPGSDRLTRATATRCASARTSGGA